MSELVYDPRFDNVEVEVLTHEQCKKQRLLNVLEAGIDPSEYVSLDDLQREFRVSRYQIANYLDEIGAKPFGEKININENGKRSRGVGKVVYQRAVINRITELLESEEDLEAIRAIAREIRES